MCQCQKSKNKHGKGKNLSSSEPTQLERDFFSQVETSKELVPLCLKTTVELPVYFPGTYGGKDVVVIAPDSIGYGKVINVRGHNDVVTITMRDALMRAYPNLFECQDAEKEKAEV